MYQKYLKRMLDILISVVGLPFFAVLFCILAPMIFLEDRGPVFYTAERLGRNGKFFQMIKFRSMKTNSPDLRNADGSTFNSSNDPRVTRIGRVMRKTSLDETPQLLNVLKGDMSLVGPRAHLTTTYPGFELLDDRRKKRLSVRPGITGYTQAFFRNSIGTEEKIDNDCYYVDHISFWMDVKILFATAFSVLKQDNLFVQAEKPVSVYNSATGEFEDGPET